MSCVSTSYRHNWLQILLLRHATLTASSASENNSVKNSINVVATEDLAGNWTLHIGSVEWRYCQACIKTLVHMLTNLIFAGFFHIASVNQPSISTLTGCIEYVATRVNININASDIFSMQRCKIFFDSNAMLDQMTQPHALLQDWCPAPHCGRRNES
jgi:hypothetical protein